MKYPINIRVGLIEATIFPGKRFENRDTFEGMINPRNYCYVGIRDFTGPMVHPCAYSNDSYIPKYSYQSS